MTGYNLNNSPFQRNRLMKKFVVLCVLLGLALVPAFSQTQDQGSRQRMPAGENVVGKVTAISSGAVTVAPAAGGAPITIKVGDNTRIFKDRQPAKLTDIKVDDTVFARGPLNGTSMDAAMLGVVNPEMVQRFQQNGGTMGGTQFNREDLDKKFIAGEVKAINETRLTIARPDNQSQEIEVDESTSFKKGQESVTLADIKVGDFVRGTGEVKNGTFIPKELIVGRPRMMMGGPNDQKPGGNQKHGSATEPKPDGSDKPATPPNN
jgi:hypothetical protein